MRPRILFDLRADCRALYHQLEIDYAMVPFSPKATLAADPPVLDNCKWRYAGRSYTLDETSMVEAHWPAVTAAVAFVQSLDPAPVCAIFWNTVLPAHAAAALACRERGIPVFEVNHNRLETPLVGHFEIHSAADYLVGGQGAADNRVALGGNAINLTLGQPGYDTWEPRDRELVRMDLGLPIDRKYILKTATWTHGYSVWSDPGLHAQGEQIILAVLAELQSREDYSLLWTTRGKIDQGEVARHLVAAGFDPKQLFITDDTPIRDLVDAADVVFSHRSGVAIDGIMSERPALMFDVRPMLQDDGEYGIWTVKEPDTAAQILEEMLHNPNPFTACQKAYREYWGGTGDSGERLVEFIGELA